MTENARLRFRFSKVGKVRFTSHRDVARLWERALRRGSLPVGFTEGFNPRVKIHFGLALPTGYESLGEYVDVDFRASELDAFEATELPETLTPLLPEGMAVQAVAPIETASPSLQQAVTSCTWRIEVTGCDAAELRSAVERLLGAETLPVVRQRKGRDVEDDIRPYILGLSVLDLLHPDRVGTTSVEGSVLEADLGTHPRGLRPSELVSALGAELTGAFEPRPAGTGLSGPPSQHAIVSDRRHVVDVGRQAPSGEAVSDPGIEESLVCRIYQWVGGEGARHEPLAAQSPTTHAERRAS